MLEALLDKEITTIIDFKLYDNQSWFTEGRENNVEMLAEFISLSQNLQVLDLHWNMFSSTATERVVTTIADSAICHSLRELLLRKSANFSSDSAAEKLADIIRDAPYLTKL